MNEKFSLGCFLICLPLSVLFNQVTVKKNPCKKYNKRLQLLFQNKQQLPNTTLSTRHQRNYYN